VLGVIVTEGDITPFVQVQLASADDRPAVFRAATSGGILALYLRMQNHYAILLRTLGLQERALRGSHDLMRYRQDAEIESRIYQAPRLFGRDINAELLEQSQDGASLD
jgi:hypothetical protein